MNKTQYVVSIGITSLTASQANSLSVFFITKDKQHSSIWKQQTSSISSPMRFLALSTFTDVTIRSLRFRSMVALQATKMARRSRNPGLWASRRRLSRRCPRLSTSTTSSMDVFFSTTTQSNVRRRSSHVK